MKPNSLVFAFALFACPLFADPGQHIIPAGALVGCTLSEPKLSSRTTAVGDPVLCQIGHSERHGQSLMPFNSYLVGQFEDYKDPGHFVGKGWLQLRFDRMVIEPNTVIPLNARVVDVPGYRVDNQGRVLGKGHATRDAVMWSIPILWPIDLVMLPMRGPRPVLKEETHLTLKLMDDLSVPATEQPVQDNYGLTHREPNAENEPPPPPDEQPAPQTAYAPQPQLPQAQDVQPDSYAYAPSMPPPPPPYPYPYPAVYAPPAFAYGPGVSASGYYYGGRPYAVGPRGYGYPGAYRGYGYGQPNRGYAYGPRPRVFAYGGGPGGRPQGFGGGHPATIARGGASRGSYRR